jgi:hypothetical protein
MRYSENFSNKLNDLLNINYEVEKIYLEAHNIATDTALKTFFIERQKLRSEFSRILRNEIDKHNITPKSVSVLNKYYNKNQNIDTNFFADEEDLLAVVYRSIKASVNGYNEMLRENSLPLTLCKILVRQRDNIQDTMRVFERDNILID